jgi:hypothetical protein
MVVVVAGRRIDASDAPAPRFPLASREAVGRRIEADLEVLHASAVVSSAACGADLLAIEAARNLGLRYRIVLPYQEDWFFADSVVDRPGEWAELFQQAIYAARAAGDLVILDRARGSEGAYRAASDRILAEGQHLAADENPTAPSAALAGIIVWEGASRGPDDVTDHLRQRLRAADARVIEVISNTAAD